MIFFHHLISITQFPSIFINHPFHTHLAPSFTFPWLNIFYTICGSHNCHSMQLLFFFSIPKLTEPSKKKKKKRKRIEPRKTQPKKEPSERTKKNKTREKKLNPKKPSQKKNLVKERKKEEDKEQNSVKNVKKPLVWKEKEKKKEHECTHRTQWRKKKYGQALTDSRSLHVVIYRNVIELWVMSYKNWKQSKCVFSFHNS